MQVIKRNAKREEVSFDKITARVKKLVYGLSDHVNPIKISMKVIEGLYDGVSTSDLHCLLPGLRFLTCIRTPTSLLVRRWLVYTIMLIPSMAKKQA